ncbi:MAG: NAD(P)/FAD-dependent oxidoreductase [Chloroflexota bacterium]
MKKHYDVVVIGDGPAGASTAVFLAQQNQDVLLLARQVRPSEKVGENLSPQANPVLKELGVWDTFIDDNPLPSFGEQTSWGQPNVNFHDFINNPAGPGWHIDRALFEQCLLEQAQAVGVTITSEHALRRAQRQEDLWKLTLSGLPTPLTADFVVDATGLSSWLARRQGVTRIHTDKQVALIATLETTNEPMADSTSLVEAVQDGWWYSARTPNGRLTVSFMTDIDLHKQQQLCTPDGWLAKLAQTRHTARRVHQHDYQLATTPKFVTAGSSRLEQFWGNGWLAVGDAAMSCNPLSTHGITLALMGGKDAAEAIIDHRQGDHRQGNTKALASYGDKLDWAFSYHSLIHNRHYRQETRWLNAPYWHRRNRKTAVLV